jgi:alpha-1,3-rhamnosyltransferase
MQEENPLVSIIVITYNSAKYVLETLESAKTQTYQNIELIVSDDCSIDNTVEICRSWIDENKNRFVRTKLITIDINRGIPANCNRGVMAAQGEWVKLIAGDDKLVRAAIKDVIHFVSGAKNIRAIDSVVEVYNSNFTKKINEFNFSNAFINRKDITASEQLFLFANAFNARRIISTLGVFLRRDLILELNGFNEKYPLLEDAPMWWKILKSNNKFHYLNATTILYRRHDKAVSSIKNKWNHEIISPFQLTVLQFNWDCLLQSCSLINKANIIWFKLMYTIIKALGNQGMLAKNINSFSIMMQPIRLLWFKRTLERFFK